MAMLCVLSLTVCSNSMVKTTDFYSCIVKDSHSNVPHGINSYVISSNKEEMILIYVKFD